MADLDESPLGATINTIDYTPPTAAADAIEALTLSQLEHALDAHRRKLKIYERASRASTTSSERNMVTASSLSYSRTPTSAMSAAKSRFALSFRGRGGARFSSRIRAGRQV